MEDKVMINDLALNRMKKDGRPSLGRQVPLYLVRNLIFALEEALGEDARETLGYLGYRLGEISFAGVSGVEELVAVGRQNGIGIFEVQCISEREMTFSLAECIGCSGMAEYNEAVSAFETGIVRGAARALTGKPWDVIESRCCTAGGLKCEFSAFLVE
jgi:predicted hydrocarbon binding protein